MTITYGLVKTVVLNGTGDPDSGIKYEIYRIENDDSDFWHIIPSRRVVIFDSDTKSHVWLSLSSKTLSGSEELEDVISECKVHYSEHYPSK